MILYADQATEPIVDGAIRAGKPYAVVPCCVFASLAPHRRTPTGEPVVHLLIGSSTLSIHGWEVNTKQFAEYLLAKHADSRSASLRFEGRNRVVRDIQCPMPSPCSHARHAGVQPDGAPRKEAEEGT
jgi:hypothetical protein